MNISPLIIQVGLWTLLVIVASAYLSTFWGAPWVPCPIGTAMKMLSMANLQPGDKFVDLGAGDGRLVVLASLKFGAQAVGVEIDPVRCALANMLIWGLGLRDRAHVYHGNLFHFDVSGADVVAVYLLQGTNQKLKARLADQLQPGARVVSHAFSMSGWAPLAIDERRGIFLYEIGKTGRETWTKMT